jgi:benzil reductase ((S)-benzoin forming)
MTTAVWISGASSGIGAALARSVPYEDARVLGISRRPPAVGEHLAADLSDVSSWSAVSQSFEAVLRDDHPERAVLLHFSGNGAPHGPIVDADPDEYARSVILGAAAGQVLGQAFLRTCRHHGVPAVLVVCSSPGALEPHRGMAHYGAGKSALLYWTAVARDEESGSVILAVIPWATDTPMLRDAMDQPVETNPVSGMVRAAFDAGEVATPADVAAEIWNNVVAGAPVSPLHVGIVPEGVS